MNVYTYAEYLFRERSTRAAISFLTAPTSGLVIRSDSRRGRIPSRRGGFLCLSPPLGSRRARGVAPIWNQSRIQVKSNVIDASHSFFLPFFLLFYVNVEFSVMLIERVERQLMSITRNDRERKISRLAWATILDNSDRLRSAGWLRLLPSDRSSLLRCASPTLRPAYPHFVHPTMSRVCAMVLRCTSAPNLLRIWEYEWWSGLSMYLKKFLFKKQYW